MELLCFYKIRIWGIFRKESAPFAKALTAVLILAVVLILVLVVVLVLILVLIAVLVLVLIVIHDTFLHFLLRSCRYPIFPQISRFILGLKNQARDQSCYDSCGNAAGSGG